MGQVAEAAMAEAEADDEEAGAPSYKSKISTVERKCRALKTQITRVCADNSNLREANATLCHALRQNGLVIPAGAELTAQALGEQLTAGNRPILSGIAPPPPDNALITDDAPIKDKYVMRQLYLPDTSTITAATKFKLDGKVWPHAIATYERFQDALAPIVECRARQHLDFQLYDRRDNKKKVTETVLKPGTGNNPIINFKLECVYDDTGGLVTINSLAESKRGEIRALAVPETLNAGNLVAPMENGIVKFMITKLHFKSSMCCPIHRKFRWRIVAVEDEFSFLNMQSPSFWVVSKVHKVANRGVVAPGVGA